MLLVDSQAHYSRYYFVEFMSFCCDDRPNSARAPAVHCNAPVCTYIISYAWLQTYLSRCGRDLQAPLNGHGRDAYNVRGSTLRAFTEHDRHTCKHDATFGQLQTQRKHMWSSAQNLNEIQGTRGTVVRHSAEYWSYNVQRTSRKLGLQFEKCTYTWICSWDIHLSLYAYAS